MVDLAAQSIQQELENGKSQEDSWNGSTIDLVRASDVSSWLVYEDGLLARPSPSSLGKSMHLLTEPVLLSKAA